MKNRMSKMDRLLSALVFLTVFGVLILIPKDGSTHKSKGNPEVRHSVRLILNNYAAEMAKLQKLDLDIAGVNLAKNLVDLIVTEDELTLLEKSGFKIQRTFTELSGSRPDAEYKTPEKVETLLKKYTADYPAITQLKQIGKSVEGRPIWAIKITNHAEQKDLEKPTILFNGMHHAREVMSSEVPVDIIDSLLTGYGKDAKITHWVDANEIWVIPMLNVDGNNKVWTSNNWWRKNTRGGYGVDINRNYPYAWNTCNGSSGNPSSDTFRGPSGGSEPETQTLMGLVKDIHPVFDISFHSYSELVIYPYGCPNQHTQTKEVVEAIGAEIANLLPSDDGSGHYTSGTAPELLYAVDGGDIDWLYHEAQVLPYVIELNSSSQGFQPSYSQWRDRTVQKIRPAWGLLLDKLDASSIRGQTVTVEGGIVANSVITLERLNTPNQPFTQTYRVNADGTYHLVLNPGAYNLTYSAPGFQSQTKKVTVEGQRVNETVQLAKP